MKIETEADLARICDMLKAKGVKFFEVDGICVEFGATVEAHTEAAAPTEDPDVCKCGHPVYAHNSGFCIHGCDVEKCAPESKTQA